MIFRFHQLLVIYGTTEIIAAFISNYTIKKREGIVYFASILLVNANKYEKK